MQNQLVLDKKEILSLIKGLNIESRQQHTDSNSFLEFTDPFWGRHPVICRGLNFITIPLKYHLSNDQDFKQPNQECDYEDDEKYPQVAWTREAFCKEANKYMV